MGRTAESYLRESNTTPIERLFSFADPSWTEQRLWERANELQGQHLVGEREAERLRELGHIAFELACQQTEASDGE